MDTQTDNFFEQETPNYRPEIKHTDSTEYGFNKIKDSGTEAKGNDPITEAQRDYLKTLSQVNGETYDINKLTRAEAAELIDAKKQNITVPPPYDMNAEYWHPESGSEIEPTRGDTQPS